MVVCVCVCVCVSVCLSVSLSLDRSIDAAHTWCDSPNNITKPMCRLRWKQVPPTLKATLHLKSFLLTLPIPVRLVLSPRLFSFVRAQACTSHKAQCHRHTPFFPCLLACLLPSIHPSILPSFIPSFGPPPFCPIRWKNKPAYSIFPVRVPPAPS